ncbi:MAG: D-alanyl-D-alanine carboxypeptidase family protein [Thiotrichales bacterium]
MIRLLTLSLLLIPTLAFSRPIPAPPALAADSYLLADANSGSLIAEKEVDKKIEPASITKLMSAYLVFQAIKDKTISENDAVVVSEKAWRMQGSRMFIEVGKTVPVSDLLKGMIVQSGNDATVALAEHVAGTEEAFVGMMNDQAAELGMTGTHFTNATGWPDPDHYTTARDILALAKALMTDYPEFYPLYSEKTFTYNDISQSNRNRLLWMDKRVDGLKTGHTDSAGYCLVSSARQNDTRLIAIVLGAKNDNERIRQSKALLDYGFRFYETRQLYNAGEKLLTAKIWKGAADTVDLGVRDALYVTFPKGRYEQLDAKLDHPKTLEAPINQGDEVGTITVALGDKVLDKRPLVALNGVEAGGFLSQFIDRLMMTFE